MTETKSRYSLVDATAGARLLLGFHVADEPLRRRLPRPWGPNAASPAAYADAAGQNSSAQTAANLVLVFNDLLLNQDEQGRAQADASARDVGFNIPSKDPATAHEGMVHFRIFTGNPKSVPGRYHDSLPARVNRELHLISAGASTRVSDHWSVEPAAGGVIDLRLTYERGPLVRIVGQEPNFPVWAAADTGICRVYQEDTLLDVIRLDAGGINRVSEMQFQVTVPELTDLFTGDERPVFIFDNPNYSRRVFSQAAGSTDPPRAGGGW
jgi:hypothetical protein